MDLRKMHIWLKSINEYRNKESSQATLEAETDEARSKVASDWK